MSNNKNKRARFLAALFACAVSLLALPSFAQGAVERPEAVTSAPALTEADLSAWLDGMIPPALERGDVAGAVVTVVKDGQVLLAKGYGYADVEKKKPVDPQATLFRPGSISKLFTWTAVMQLVEQGKLDLDRDVNTYLDFKIPDAFGKPITLRNIMTHTPGFEEVLKNGLLAGPDLLLPLGDALKKYIPSRIFPPGTTPAYSNYGTALAGYIVERVSGQKFNDYIDQHIFKPLGMARSTFAEPLPDALKPFTSEGYVLASGKPGSYEIIQGLPAGSLASTGADIARFMIAHLNNGTLGDAQILKPETAKLMHAPAFKPVANMNGMALGFFQSDRNGQRVISHGGDTILYHSDLHLLLDANVGIFISVNSLGKAGAGGQIRGALYEGFMDRYFPAPAQAKVPTAATAAEHGRELVGNYLLSRRLESSFLRLGNVLSQATLTLQPDNTIAVDGLKTPAGVIKHWREIGPYVWQDVDGPNLLTAVRDGDGKVAQLIVGDFPLIMVFQPSPGSENKSWNQPLLAASIGILLLTVVLWPVAAIVRRSYGQRLAPQGTARRDYRLVRVVSLFGLLCLVPWLVLISSVGMHMAMFNDGFDIWLRLLQLIGVIALGGTVFVLWNTIRIWRDPARGWWSKIANGLIAFALLGVAWFVLGFHLLALSLGY